MTYKALLEMEEVAEKELSKFFEQDLEVKLELSKVFKEAFLRELKKQLKIAYVDITSGVVRCFKRLILISLKEPVVKWNEQRKYFEGTGKFKRRFFWFPFLRSAYFRAKYDPYGPSSYYLQPQGNLMKRSHFNVGPYDVELDYFTHYNHKNVEAVYV